jgi:transposase
MPDTEPLPDDIDALRAALVAERTARHEAEARATGAEAMIAHLKLMIARLQRDRFGPTSERSRRLFDQLELQLESKAIATSLHVSNATGLYHCVCDCYISLHEDIVINLDVELETALCLSW